MTKEEAYEKYQATLHDLECARLAHDQAYKASETAYRIWVNLGGDHKTEAGYGKRDT